MTAEKDKLFATTTEFASFGKSAIAYVRKVRSEDLNEVYPKEVNLPEGLDLWGLFGADGRPIAVADEEHMVVADAHERDLMPVHRH